MNCLQIQEMISLYIDDQLDEWTKKEVKNHLMECQVCKEEYEKMLEYISLCKDLPMIDLPEDFAESLHEKLVDVQKSTKRKSINKINWKVFTSVAAMLVIGITSMSLFYSPKDIKEEIYSTKIEYFAPKESNSERNMEKVEDTETLKENKKDIENPKKEVKKSLSQKESNDPQNSVLSHDVFVEEKLPDYPQDNDPKVALYNGSQEVPTLRKFSIQQSTQSISQNVSMTIHIPKNEFIQMVKNLGGNLEVSKDCEIDEVKTKRNVSQMEEMVVYIPKEKLLEFEKQAKELGEVEKYLIEDEEVEKNNESPLEKIENLQTQEPIHKGNQDIDQFQENVKNSDEEMEMCTIYVSLYNESNKPY
ncbi:anti-sigma factor family protein [Inediibacterium massiliense]|uniref:anti-sigma factor family protein n=1 Tax=Inediibacterium massiliense TaxID=1658111 RepID=UPI0006B63A3F|nr:zf-HC2 domain-containing protein [Inediibacterium massiliense]